MTWVKITDDFPKNIKVMTAGLEARALYITALCHCNENLTDGFVDAKFLPSLAIITGISDHVTSAARLVEVGLWEQVDGGYKITQAIKISFDNFPDRPPDWFQIRHIVLERDNYECVYCGCDANSVDHVMPKFHMGTHALNNLVAACRKCNSSKGKTSLLEWYHRQPFFTEDRLDYIFDVTGWNDTDSVEKSRMPKISVITDTDKILAFEKSIMETSDAVE